MLEMLLGVTAAVCGLSIVLSWLKFRDVFHPLVLVTPMFMFMYVVMPWWLLKDGALFTYVTEAQCSYYQGLVVLCIASFVLCCFLGSSVAPNTVAPLQMICDRRVLQLGAYWLGSLGLGAWLYAIGNVGGITNAFGRVKGMGWSEYGYIREAAYLMIVAQLLLLSPEGWDPKNKRWQLAVLILALPYTAQGLLGAQRGPTFLICATIGLSWYLARGRRPSIPILAVAGSALGTLLLFLVMNRGNIYLGSEAELSTNVGEFFQASEANEYIFGTGCVAASRQTGNYFWGKRYLAQIMVRPIPKQIWPTKYEDFGVPELLQNAGVAGGGLAAVVGWSEIPGAAASMVADVWVEFAWLSIPVLGLVGWAYGRIWRYAVTLRRHWTTMFVIMILLSIYFVTQSGEAVIFRLFILTVPSLLVWKQASKQASFNVAHRMRTL